MKECIILAGGLGTRLQSVVKDVPKCMAEVAGNPFLKYLFDYAAKQKIEHIILALGYKSDIIIDWLANQSLPFDISYVIEKEPLGTGGAIQYAFSKIKSEKAYIINGDTYFDVDLEKFSNSHISKKADISLALKPMTDFDRYGSVLLDTQDRIIRFNEKKYCQQGLINGGTYLVNKNIFAKLNLPQKYSFEKDILESKINDISIYGYEQDSYFIDIGIPSDFEKANKDFKTR
ncbi:MAG: nucleotidyltransferase family protein [Dysgonomonas sp.]